MTYNVRFDNPDDPFPWPKRRAGVAGLLQTLASDVFGLQEVLAHQLSDLAAALPGYTHVGVGRGPRLAEELLYTPTSGECKPVPDRAADASRERHLLALADSRRAGVAVPVGLAPAHRHLDGRALDHLPVVAEVLLERR